MSNVHFDINLNTSFFQALSASAVVVGLSQLGNPSSFSASQKSGPSSVASIGLGGDTERLGAAPDLVTTLDGVFTVTPHLANTFLVEEAGQDSASLAVPSHAHMVHHRSPHTSSSHYGIIFVQ